MGRGGLVRRAPHTIRRVFRDIGSGYVSTASRTAIEALSVRHKRTRAYTLRANGEAERFIQTLLPEWAYVVPTPHCGNAETARDGTYASAAASGRMPR